MFMSRIELADSTMSMILKMVEGNPGATTACLDLMSKSPAIDPDSAMGEFSTILMLDTYEIYGPRIWMFYSDVCGRDCKKVIALIRAVQLGLMSLQTLQHAIDNRGDGIDHNSVLAMVQEQLPNFGKNE